MGKEKGELSKSGLSSDIEMGCNKRQCDLVKFMFQLPVCNIHGGRK